MLGGRKIDIKVGGDFDPVPMDKYTVLIADVDLIIQFNKWKGVEVELLKYQFIILDDKETEDGSSTRGRYLWHRMSPSLSPKSWLLKFAKATYGRELTKEEMEEFDPEELVGKQVDVMVENSENEGQVYNNIVSYSKTVKKLEPVSVKQEVSKTAPVQRVSSSVIKKAEEVLDGGLGLEEEDEELKALEEAAARKRAELTKSGKKIGN